MTPKNMEMGRAGKACPRTARINNVNPRPEIMDKVQAAKVVQLYSAALATRME
jgi:hypothetical protein